MSKISNVQDWLDTHIGGDCSEANDCLITLAQAIKVELSKDIADKVEKPYGVGLFTETAKLDPGINLDTPTACPVCGTDPMGAECNGGNCE